LQPYAIFSFRNSLRNRDGSVFHAFGPATMKDLSVKREFTWSSSSEI